jgi:hypothetical protein
MVTSPGGASAAAGCSGRGHDVAAKVEQTCQARVLCAQPVQPTAKVVDVVGLGIGHDHIVPWATSGQSVLDCVQDAELAAMIRCAERADHGASN